MGVRFVIGRAGSGKTLHCFRSIVEELRARPLGPPIYWILPRQATFSAERELACNSGLNGFTRVRIVSFDQLGEEILSECGGCAVPRVTAIGRQMLLGHLLRQHRDDLKYFKAVAHQPGLALRLDGTFGEFERSGHEPEALLSVIEEMGHSAEGDLGAALLRDKLSDLHLLYTEYRAFIGQERLDPHMRLTQMLACLDRSEALRGATMYVDGFHDFTGNERQTLARLARVAGHIDVTLLMDPQSPLLGDPHLLPNEMGLFFQLEDAYRRLYFAFAEAGVEPAAPLLLGEVRRFQDPSIQRIEVALFSRAAKPADATGGIEMIAAPDRRAEVDAAARRIRALTGDGGVRLRDIALLVRDLEAYHELIDASFREHGIPYFVDRRRGARHHPLLRFLHAVLELAQQTWPNDAMMTLARSGLAGLTLEQADELENYVLLHRLHGNAWASTEPWRYERKLIGRRDDAEDDPAPSLLQESADRADAIRRSLVERLIPFIDATRGQASRPVRDTIADLFSLLEAFDVRRRLAGWIDAEAQAERYERRDEHEQVWNELMDLLDQVVDLLGDERVAIDDLVAILETGLESFDLALTPPTVDQVLVGDVSRTRTPMSLGVAIVLGLNEGHFPRTVREDSILADDERRTLNDRDQGLDLDAGSQRRLLDENFLGYYAFTRAARRLIVTRPAADNEGRAVAPSPFWHRLRRLFPSLEPLVIERAAGLDCRHLGTPRQLVTSLMQWVRSGATSNDAAASTDPDGQVLAALYQWLCTHECCNDTIDVMRYRAWRALSYQNEASLSPEVAARLFPTPLHASVTRMETFATCPFKHFLRFGLRLEACDEPDVTAMDLGNVYHQVLERIVREMLASRRDWLATDAAITDEKMIHAFAEEVGRTLRGELMLSTARNKYLLKRIEQTLKQVIEAQRAAMRRGAFRPAAAEVGFGVEGAVLPPLQITTPRGRKLLLHGKIDRVDINPAAGDCAVIDYKLSDHKLSLVDVAHGLSLQLLTYLLVLQSSGEKLFGRPLTPAAAFYVQLLRTIDPVKHPDKALPPGDPLFHLRVKPRGIFDARVLPELDNQFDSGKSDVVAASRNKDGQLGNLDRSDVAAAAEFQAMLRFVQRRIGELADQIITGGIAIRPYRMGKTTPCPRCEFQSVCRFDPSINRYETVQPMKRSEALQFFREKAGSDGA